MCICIVLYATNIHIHAYPHKIIYIDILTYKCKYLYT